MKPILFCLCIQVVKISIFKLFKLFEQLGLEQKQFSTKIVRTMFEQFLFEFTP